MASESRFLLLGEPIAVDLVNTRISRDGAIADLLDGPGALTVWLQAQRGRVAWRGKTTSADLASVRALRDAIDALLRALREHRRPPKRALDEVNGALRGHGAERHLTWAVAGPRLVASPRSQRSALLRALAADAARVLTGPQSQRVRECAHPDCRLQFVAGNARRRCARMRCAAIARAWHGIMRARMASAEAIPAAGASSHATPELPGSRAAICSGRFRHGCGA